MDFGLGAISSSGGRGQGFDMIANSLPPFFTHTPRRTFNKSFIRNDIPVVTAFNMGNADQSSGEGIHIPADHSLDSTDKSRRCYDGIDTFIRMSCMDALAMKSNTKSIDSRHGRTIDDPHLTDIEKGRAVHSKNRIDIINNARFNDFQGSARTFFSRLENNTDSSLNIGFPSFQ